MKTTKNIQKNMLLNSAQIVILELKKLKYIIN